MPGHDKNKTGFKEKYKENIGFKDNYKENIYIFFAFKTIKALVALVHYECHWDLFIQYFPKRPEHIAVSTYGTISLTPVTHNQAPSE